MEHESRALNCLKKMAGIFEASRTTTYTCSRKTRAGTVQEVRVDILDAGPDNPDARYRVVALSETGKRASGKAGHSIEVAVGMVPWWNLDD